MLLLALLATTVTSWAQKKSTDIVGTWLSEKGNAKIAVYEQNKQFFGKLVWVADAAKKDIKNPNEALRQQPLLGKIILTNFVFKEEEWVNGNIYDPESGKTYSCIIKLKSDGKLSIRGFIGISLFGKTTIWTKS